MATLALEAELYKRIEQVAQASNQSINDTLAEAVRQYLWELDRRKISEETAIYRRQHTELKNKYLGQFIAMRNGQVVDNDSDFTSLRKRVVQRFGSTPVMITRVEESDDPMLMRRGFRAENTTA